MMACFLFTRWTFFSLLIITLGNCLEQASFYGNSYISIPLKEAKGSTDISFKFRTHLSNALILLVAGATDYCIVRLDNARLKLNINLGSGEFELASPFNAPLNDFEWHEVSILRKEANLSFVIDNITTIKRSLPGKFFELNIHYGLFVGSHGNFTDIFFGHLENFRGCLADLVYNDIRVLDQARRRLTQAVVHGVTWNCAPELNTYPDHPLSFVSDEAFMTLTYSQPRSLKWQLEIKTLVERSIVLYNSGSPSKQDLFALKVWKGKLKVVLKISGKIFEVAHDSTVNDGEWHVVHLHVTASAVNLSVDSVLKSVKLPKAGGHYFESNNVFYVGGIESSKRTRAMAKGLKTADSNFKGCLRNLKAGERQLGLRDARVSEGILSGCLWKYPCLKNPCDQGTECIEDGLDSYHCKNANGTNKSQGGGLATDFQLLSLLPLEVVEGQSTLITATNLNVILDYPKYGINESGINFHVIEVPEHGSIVIDVWPHEKNSFTLSDISKDKVHYVHDGSEHLQDKIVFQVEFSSGEWFILPAYLQGRYKFTLNINIAPVNDPPTLNISPTTVLRLAEGTRKVISKELLHATDPDSPVEQLVYSVLDPGPGYLEYVQKPGVSVASFSQQDIDNEQVAFVHNRTGINEGFLSFEISDGIETSKGFRLRLSLFPQSWRLQNNTGVVLIHKTFAVITAHNLSFVSNVPDAVDKADFQIVQGPQFGVVEVENNDGAWQSSTRFSSDDLRQRRVRYRHTSFQPDHDEFQFCTSHNTSYLYTFRMTFVKCSLSQVAGLSFRLNTVWDTFVTTEQLFFKTTPIEAPTTSIIISLRTLPKYGYLYFALSKYRLRLNDTFTQKDIVSKNVKYRLYQKAYSYVLDEFSYIVTAPGCNNVTGNTTIEYVPSKEEAEKVQITLKPLSVQEGSKANITLTFLNILSSFTYDLVFNITQPPMHGTLQLSRENGVRNGTALFTYEELSSNRLSYIHDDSESQHDTFHFMALSSSSQDLQYVDIFHIDILLKNDNSPVRTIEKIFQVVIDGKKLLTGNDLRYSDADIDSKPSDIIYTCHEMPNGKVYNVKNTSLEISEFTQENLDKGLIVFKHSGPHYAVAKLWITDGQFYINGLLEIQALPPFVRVSQNKRLIVQHRKSAVVSEQHLASITNLYATDRDIIYEVVKKPVFGKMVSSDLLQELSEFSQAQVNEGYITYIHERGTENADEVGLHVRCRDAVSTAQLNIWMLPATYWDPLTITTCRSLVVEESTSALVNKNILEVTQADVPASAITYHIIESPQNGYLSILPNSQGADEPSSNPCSFPQTLINENRLLYIQSGANETDDTITFNVTNGMVWLNSLKLKVKIIPEHLYLGSTNITVKEGGNAPFSSGNLFVLTEYYKQRVNDYVILQQPMHGCIQIYRKCNKFHGFSHKELLGNVVQYSHDGSESLRDEVVVVAVAGTKRSFPITIPVIVEPVNNQEPRIVNNTGLVMWEGGTAVITNNMLGAVDEDRPPESLQYRVLGSWWGNVSLVSDPNTALQFFTQDLIAQNLVAFRHQNGSEAKFTFTISDGIHITSENSFFIQTNPVHLQLLRKSGSHVFPLQSKLISSENLLATVSDPERPVTYQIVTPPSLGRLMKVSDSKGLFKVVHSFTQSDVNSSLIVYEHTHPFADLYTNDSFTFTVLSHLAEPLVNQTFKIDISVSSGGLDAYITIPKIKVDEGGVTGIPVNISGMVMFLEHHSGLKAPVIHALVTAPEHGQILLHNTSNVSTFTQQQLESGLVHYQHDHSDSLSDQVHFSLYLIPGYVILCNITVNIEINPINDQPFKLVTPAPHLMVVQGENHTIIADELKTEDADTGPEDIWYDVISGPNEGQLALLPDALSTNHFSQEDINENKLVYVHNGISLTDTFHLRVWDEKFRPDYTIFSVNVIPVSVNVSVGLPLYLQQGSNVVLLSSKQFNVETNADIGKISYTVREPPKHGVLYVKDTPATMFNQNNLEYNDVMYMQTDMTTSNDSLRIYIGLPSGNGSIGHDVDIEVNVQPLMQIGNFTAIAGRSNRLFLDATPLAKLTNSNPRYIISTSPVHGELRKIIRSSGEKRNVLDSVVQSFTHEEVQSGLIYLVIKDMEVGWDGIPDQFRFTLAASIFQPANGELKYVIRSALYNDIHSTLAGPSDPAGHEGGMQMASPNITRDYFLIVSMVIGVIILGIAVIIIIKCRALDPDELINKEDQCLQPIALPRPPDRMLPSHSPLKQHVPDGFVSPIPTALPHCKVTPLSDSHARYPYGIDEHTDDWSSCDNSDPACLSRNNIMLRRNQYWV